jgi:hypothetical protein
MRILVNYFYFIRNFSDETFSVLFTIEKSNKVMKKNFLKVVFVHFLRVFALKNVDLIHHKFWGFFRHSKQREPTQIVRPKNNSKMKLKIIFIIRLKLSEKTFCEMDTLVEWARELLRCMHYAGIYQFIRNISLSFHCYNQLWKATTL